MSNDNDSKRPSHIAYQVREGEENKAYFNRIGAVWPHRDGEGFNIELDSFPKDRKVVIRTVQERIQDAKETSRGGDRRDDRRSSGREDRSGRDNGPRYER